MIANGPKISYGNNRDVWDNSDDYMESKLLKRPSVCDRLCLMIVWPRK